VFEIIAMLEALVALEDWDALVAFLPRARAFGDALVLVEPAGDGRGGAGADRVRRPGGRREAASTRAGRLPSGWESSSKRR
jgi:hypothetical protein